VSVTDQDDNPVTTLTQQAFTVKEDGNQRTVLNVSNPATGAISVALALDYSSSITPHITDVHSGATAFIGDLSVNDEAAIIKFAESVNDLIPGFTSDTTLLDNAINNVTFTDTGQTHLYDAVYQAVDLTSAQIGNRQAVVVLSDGHDEGSVNYTTVQEVVDHANAVGVPIFTIGIGDASYFGILQIMANETGGQFFYYDSTDPSAPSLQDIYNKIASILSGQYVVTYTPSSTAINTISVEVNDINTGNKGGDSKSVTLTTCP